MTIGLMGAMPEETQSLVDEIGPSAERIQAGMRTYYKGLLWGQPVVLVTSRCGKVAAASTATHLIGEFDVDEIIFTGVAGHVDPELHVGDVVIGTSLYQHDIDASPLFPKLEIPLLGRSHFATDEPRRVEAAAAARAFIEQDLLKAVSTETLSRLHITRPKVIEGQIASGDQFVSCSDKLDELRLASEGTSCVEMEGAAVAQVCFEHDIPLTVIRTISDSADEAAPDDFWQSLTALASVYSHGIICRLFRD